MQVTVKNLRGETCTLDIQPDMKITDIKRLVEVSMKIPASQQTLIAQGKVLNDERLVGSYSQLKEGVKLFVTVRKPLALNVALEKFLRQYYSESQTKQIVDSFMKDFNEQVKSLSLDDLERIAISDLHNDYS